MWDATKAVLREKFTAVNSFKKRSQIDDFRCHLKKLTKKKMHIEPKVGRREIKKVRMEINEIKNRLEKKSMIN